MKSLYRSFTITLILAIGTFYANAQFKVIAYYPTWTGYPGSFTSIDLAKITHLNIAFYNPNAAGKLTNADGFTTANIASVVTASHAKNVKVLVSIGGAGAPGNYYQTQFASNASTLAFIATIVNFVVNNNLDGIDVDIEGDILNGTTITSAKYQYFVVNLATALHANNKLMSAALATWFESYVTTTAAQSFDYIGLMSYDAAIPGTGDSPGPHSPYQLAVDDLVLWKGKGVSPSKLVVGVPFYGYGWGTYADPNNNEITYCTIISTYPGVQNSDSVGSGANAIYYNGIPTIKRKTNLALASASGIMIWEITEDCPTTNSNSLLVAINQVLNSATTASPVITFNNINKVYGDPNFNVTATSTSIGAITYSVLSGTGASISPSGLVNITGAGNVIIQASQAANGNYLAGTATASIAIAKKALTVTADGKSRVYNTANPIFTVSYAGFVGSDNSSSLTALPTATTSAIISSNVGVYSIIPGGAASNNYSFSYVNGALTITGATNNISLSNINKTYGDPNLNVTATSTSIGAITYSVLSGTGASISPSGLVNITGAGNVIIQASQAANGNYLAGTATASISIAKKALTVTADGKSRVYNTANPIFTVSYAGFVGPDNSSSLTALPTATTSAIISSNVGVYSIVPGGAASNNYSFSYVNGALTITGATNNISLSNINKVYSDPAFNVTATSTSIGAITYSVLFGTGASISPSGSVTITGAGNVIIQASQAANGNYLAGTATTSIAIAQAIPNISFTSPIIGNVGDQITLSVSSNSTGAITYNVVTGSTTATYSLAGNILTLNSAGEIVVQAIQSATNNFQSSTATETITSSFTTGISDLCEKSSELIIYPNPFVDFVTVKSVDNILNIELLDASNQSIYIGQPTENETSISTGSLPNGIYLLRVTTSKGGKVFKVVK